MSFVASPWDNHGSFHLIPQLSLRVTVEPSTWEVINTEAKLSLEKKYTDIMLPELQVNSIMREANY